MSLKDFGLGDDEADADESSHGSLPPGINLGRASPGSLGNQSDEES